MPTAETFEINDKMTKRTLTKILEANEVQQGLLTRFNNDAKPIVHLKGHSAPIFVHTVLGDEKNSVFYEQIRTYAAVYDIHQMPVQQRTFGIVLEVVGKDKRGQEYANAHFFTDGQLPHHITSIPPVKDFVGQDLEGLLIGFSKYRNPLVVSSECYGRIEVYDPGPRWESMFSLEELHKYRRFFDRVCNIFDGNIHHNYRHERYFRLNVHGFREVRIGGYFGAAYFIVDERFENK